MGKYSALKIIIWMYRIVGAIIPIIGVIGFALSLGSQGDLASGLLVLAGSILMGLTIFASAQLIQLFVDIEANTRATRDYLEKRSRIR